MHDKTIRTIGATVVLLGVAIAGLAQLESNASSGPVDIVTADRTTPTGDGAIPSDATLEPSEPFTYRVGVLSGITTDNFWAFYGAQPSTWNSYILGPTKPALYSVGSDGSLLPELASADVTPTVGEDGWHVTIPLDEGMSWSDGEPVTAEDVVFTFNTARSLGLAGSWAEAFPPAIESMHVEDVSTLRIEFTARPNLSEWPHGVGLAPIMPRHVWEESIAGLDSAGLYALSGDIDVSGGPLTLVAASETLVVSNANPGYPFGASPDTVEYHVYADEQSAVDAVASGEIDTVLTPKGLTAEHIEAVRSDPAVSVLESPANGLRYLGFNLKRAPMTDRAFRTALALLLDREGLSESIPQTGDPAWSMIPEANTQWFDAEAVTANEQRFDGDAASRLSRALEGLRGEGYSWTQEPTVSADGVIIAGSGLTIDGQTPQPLTILTPGDAYDPARPQYVQEIANTLALLGFDARPVETDFDTVVDLAFTPGEDGALHYDMYLLGWTLGNPALPNYYRLLFAAEGPLNSSGYSSTEFAEALDVYEGAFTAEQAMSALWDMEHTLSVDLPYLPLYTSPIVEIYRSDRVRFDLRQGLGGLQARLGGISDVRPIE